MCRLFPDLSNMTTLSLPAEHALTALDRALTAPRPRELHNADARPASKPLITAAKGLAPGDRSGWEGITLFHEPWWLDAVAPGAWTMLIACNKGREVGILPIWKHTRRGFSWWTWPPMTHVLGPAINLGEGNAQSRRQHRFSVTEQLLAQIPEKCCFRQLLDPSVPDVLAFQAHGFATAPQYTVLIDCSDLEEVWSDSDKAHANSFGRRRPSSRLRPGIVPRTLLNFM